MENREPRVPAGDAQRQVQSLAQEILRLCQSTLLVDLRFLAPALTRLAPVDDGQTVTLATNGDALGYNPVYVVKRWQTDRAAMIRSYLHMALHCVYHHPFMDAGAMLPACWDLACDIAVEAGIDALELDSVRVERGVEAELTLETLRRALRGGLTAERIYRHYAAQALSLSELEALRAPFFRDDHSLWYERSLSRQDEQPKAAGDADGGGGDAGEGKQKGDPEDGQEGHSPRPDTDGKRPAGPPRPDKGELKAQWDRIAARVQTDLETHSRQWSDRAGGLLINLKEGARRRMSYRDFLRRFAVLSETAQSDPDGYDPILYTYGTRLYGNMPLIEPPESCERELIRDFVIVIDTSGSVQGGRIEAFFRRTCEILLEQNTFDRRMCLHIVECDAAVGRDTVIRTPEELQSFLTEHTLHGRGGTDFRPAFEYVQTLQSRGELENLRGILYLTDGEGTYPAAPPKCETAFLFVDREDADAKVPPWAIRVLVDARSMDQPQILYFA